MDNNTPKPNMSMSENTPKKSAIQTLDNIIKEVNDIKTQANTEEINPIIEELTSIRDNVDKLSESESEDKTEDEPDMKSHMEEMKKEMSQQIKDEVKKGMTEIRQLIKDTLNEE